MRKEGVECENILLQLKLFNLLTYIKHAYVCNYDRSKNKHCKMLEILEILCKTVNLRKNKLMQ